MNGDFFQPMDGLGRKEPSEQPQLSKIPIAHGLSSENDMNPNQSLSLQDDQMFSSIMQVSGISSVIVFVFYVNWHCSKPVCLFVTLPCFTCNISRIIVMTEALK